MMIKWSSNKIKYLGVFLSNDSSLLYNFNYNPINESIRIDIQRWSTYPLDLSDRIKVVKMNILPRLLISIPSGKYTVKTIHRVG